MIQGREKNRPKFPKRAVITGGMPYGNKELHFGTSAEFLFMPMPCQVPPIGKRMLFSYPVPTARLYFESYRRLVKKRERRRPLRNLWNITMLQGSIDRYLISLNLFSASGLGRPKRFRQVSKKF